MSLLSLKNFFVKQNVDYATQLKFVLATVLKLSKCKYESMIRKPKQSTKAVEVETNTDDTGISILTQKTNPNKSKVSYSDRVNIFG